MNETLRKIINTELCVGCGACVVGSECEMKWNLKGFLEPSNISCVLEDANRYCPFNLTPEKVVMTEKELADIFLAEAPHKSNDRIGHYYKTYVGYAEKYRKTSSSGGLATYITAQLLEDEQVDFVVSVGKGAADYYDYKISSSVDELLTTSKTKYYPVSMANALKHIEDNDGRYAIVGTACFIKAIRLLQYYNPLFKKRIKFTVGIICGGQKSKYYTDYLASHLKLSPNSFVNPLFRVKDEESTAIDYSFSCIDSNGATQTLKMQSLGDMWGTGLFKNNACDFCEDVTAELADISLGDAWLSPYVNDGKGHNVIVTRSKLGNEIISNGSLNKSLSVSILSLSAFLKSQKGSFNHRHIGLPHRASIAQKKERNIPPKRFLHNKPSLIFKLVQSQRMRVRSKSLSCWRSSPGKFEQNMNLDLQLLKLLTKIYHRLR